MLTPREQGDVGELSAMEWLAGIGASVAYPIGHSPNWDLIAEIDGRRVAGIVLPLFRAHVRG